MKTSVILPIALVSFCVVGCSSPTPPPPPPPPPIDMDAMKMEVQAMEDAYAEGTINKDVDAVVAYYADDLVSYLSENQPVRGKEAMRQRLAERMEKDTSGYMPTFKVLELYVGKDHITEIGSWVDTDPAGTVVDEGTYFSIFEKHDDAWVCIRDIAVSHTPKKDKMEEAASE